MGYNTVALFLNDRITDVRTEAQRSIDHIYERALRNDRNHGPFGIQVLPAYHADQAPIILGGANSIEIIGEVHWSQKEDIPSILRAIAYKHGFTISIRNKP